MEIYTAASAVWIAHGLVMNGGVLHCGQALSKRELRKPSEKFTELERV